MQEKRLLEDYAKEFGRFIEILSSIDSVRNEREYFLERSKLANLRDDEHIETYEFTKNNLRKTHYKNADFIKGLFDWIDCGNEERPNKYLLDFFDWWRENKKTDFLDGIHD